MGDIHGAFKALKQCLERARFDYEKDTLIQLGDIADGYDEVYECIEELLKIKNLIAIRGNHDAWLDDFIRTGLHPGLWNFGGKATIVSYGRYIGKEVVYIKSGSGYKTSLNESDIPSSHRQFFRDQKLYHVDGENRCFVHGGFNRNISFFQQAYSMYYWDRDLWLDAISHADAGGAVDGFDTGTRFSEIYIGHTPTLNWNTDQPMTVLNITNMDTGAGHGGRLTLMDVDSKQYWQSEPVSSLYTNSYR